jgi:hypothetical protein
VELTNIYNLSPDSIQGDASGGNAPSGSETKISADAPITVSGSGTEEDPYALGIDPTAIPVITPSETVTNGNTIATVGVNGEVIPIKEKITTLAYDYDKYSGKLTLTYENEGDTQLPIDIELSAYQTVFLDTEDPNTSTVFSDHISPAVHDPELATLPNKVYRTPRGAAYIYDSGAYYPISQATTTLWTSNNQTDTINLPITPTNDRISLHINGVYYPPDYYELASNVLSWHGPFSIEVADTVSIFFY